MRRTAAILGAVLALLGAACGNDNSDVSRDLTTARADTTVSGRITVTGSSTVEPITTLVGEAFRGQNGKVDVAVEGPGTGDGFERFCGGDADITGASRPIEPDELDACREAGVEVIELAIGLDGVAVITSPANEVECLTFADLYALVGVEAQGVDRWDEAEEVASELGSTTALPDERLVLTGPGEESGTYDAFLSIVLAHAAEERVAAGAISEDEAGTARSDYASSADDNSIIEGVAGDDGGLGWVGLSYAEQAEDVRLVPIARDPGDPCVAPTRETVQDGTYPITRDLFIYVSAEAAADRPQVAAFVDFYLEGLAGFVDEADYVPQPDPEATVARWEARTTGPAERDG
jgi:phosphate transport system substrate-binding protein